MNEPTTLTPELRGHVIALVTGNVVDADLAFGNSLFEMALETVVRDLQGLANALAGMDASVVDCSADEFREHLNTVARRAASALALARHFEAANA
ncbi:MAG: hypothetical protein ABI548_01610 [Polyangiaceae bacterium]